jgi:hypothetical protein
VIKYQSKETAARKPLEFKTLTHARAISDGNQPQELPTMNGIALLVLISLFGQVGQPPYLETERDYGWEVNPNGDVLEYIIQLAPDKVELMQATLQESLSDIPSELVGRATRIVVRIGTDVLPRTPSLAEIGKWPRFGSASDMQAQLDRAGRFSDVEPIKNVQQSDFPALPTLGGAAGTLSDAAENLIDRVGSAASNLPNVPDRFLESARNGLSGAMATPAPNTGATASRFQDTAPPIGNSPIGNSPMGGLPAGNSPLGNLPSTAPASPPPAAAAGANRDYGNWASPSARTADTRAPATFPSVAPTDPVSLIPTSPAASNNYGFGKTPSGQMPGRNLNDALQSQLQNQNDPYLNPNGQNNYAALQSQTTEPTYEQWEQWYIQQYGKLPPTPTGSMAAASSGPQFPTRVATKNSGLATNTGNSTPSASDADEGDKKAPEGDTTATAGAPDNILLVFFLLSLIVNCYLGGLIRKLLTRYRSLLSNVRSQTA